MDQLTLKKSLLYLKKKKKGEMQHSKWKGGANVEEQINQGREKSFVKDFNVYCKRDMRIFFLSYIREKYFEKGKLQRNKKPLSKF